MTTVGRLLRGVRAAVFAAVCVGLSAAGHVWMSGRALPAWSLALAFALVAAAGYALAGRQRGLLPISALMLAGEGAQHLLFAAAQAPAPVTPMQRALESLSVPASARPLPLTDWICGMGEGGAMGSGSAGARLAADLMAGHGAGMIAVHGAAGLLCAWWLSRGERAVFRLLQRVAMFAAPLLTVLWPEAVTVPAQFCGPSPADTARPARTPRLLATPVVRRGPPSPRFSM